MDHPDDNRTQPDEPTLTRAGNWLQRTHTLILPGWAYATAGAFALVLLLAALD
ncbi:hypothetical protein V8J82_06305 [Gymnodinialimonas sp. 2305UL16-5]|uniref:hypothetical protein n=1 Tax=Gymnodinialimonas mytili TaxID=3126503 RepID=UPI0030B4CD81